MPKARSYIITETYSLKTGRLLKRTVTPSTEDKSGQVAELAEILTGIGKDGKKEVLAK